MESAAPPIATDGTKPFASDARRRRRLNLLTAVSFVVCASVVALWVRGYRVADEAGLRRADLATRARATWSVRNSSGGVRLLYYRNVIREQFVYDFFEKKQPRAGRFLASGQPSPHVIKPGRQGQIQGSALGFGLDVWKVDLPDYSERIYSVVLPCWFLSLVTAYLPAAWLFRLGTAIQMQRRERAKGKCRSCGYDLRATPGRCPECGAEVSVV
jgi:hypothetical protein